MSTNEGLPFSDTHIAAIGPWPSAQVKCQYAPINREIHNLRPACVDEIWSTYIRRHPSAFDGAMVGLVELQLRTDAELRLLVRPTSYAEYIASREPAFNTQYPGFVRANPLGVTIVLLSSDNQVIVTRRSTTAEQNPGMPYFVGGYMEPLPNGDITNLVGVNASREVVEELGVRIDSVIVTGMAFDPFYCHPELFAASRVPITGKAIASTWQGARDRSETDQLILLPLSKFLSTAYQALFVNGVTWSFAAATSLFRQCWHHSNLFICS